MFIDWSTDISDASVLPLLYVSSAREYVSLPHDLLHNTGSSSKNRVESSDSVPILLDYSDNQLAITSSWDGAFHAVSIFGTEKTWSKDAANIHESIKRIGSYIKNHLSDKNLLSGDFIPVVKSLWKLIEIIYISKRDVLTFEKEASLTIQKYVGESIILFYRKQELLMFNSVNSKGKSTISNPIISLPSTAVSPPPTTNLPVAPPSNKNIESVIKKAPRPLNMRKSYVQASKSNILSSIEDVL